MLMLLPDTSLPDKHFSVLPADFQVKEIYILVQSLIQVLMGILLVG